MQKIYNKFIEVQWRCNEDEKYLHVSVGKLEEAKWVIKMDNDKVKIEELVFEYSSSPRNLLI
jgi:hypothetical protein